MVAPYVILVEDEADLREAVVEYLAMMGLDCRGVSDGPGLRAAVSEREPAAVVLDISLPGESGLSLCRWLRRETGAGVILATAFGQPLDRVIGLEIGADDYLVKPYELRELLARIRSILRRLERAPARAPVGDHSHPAETAPEPLPLGRFRFEPRSKRLLDGTGDEIRLTATELALVEIFAERPNRVLSRSMIAELAGVRADGDTRAIDIAVMRLRKKLEDPEGRQPIRTVRGEGYRLDPGEE